MIAQFGFPDGVVVETLGRAEAFVGIDVVESSAGFFAARSRRKPAELPQWCPVRQQYDRLKVRTCCSGFLTIYPFLNFALI